MSRMFKSLRAALLVPFVGVVVLVAVSISALSYYTGLKAVDQLSEQLLLDMSNRVTQATIKHLGASKVVLNAIAPSLPLGAPDQQPAALARLRWHQCLHHLGQRCGRQRRLVQRRQPDHHHGRHLHQRHGL